MVKKDTLTTASGSPIADNHNALTAGLHGPLLVQDWQLFEKHAHFNRVAQGLRLPIASAA
jgi:catalase